MSRSNSGSLLRPTILVTIASVVGQGLSAVVYVSVARGSSPTEIGPFLAAMAVAAWAVTAVEFGSSTYYTREIVVGRMTHAEFWSRSIAKEAVMSLLVSALLVGMVIARPSEDFIVLAFVGLWAAGRLGSLSLSAGLRATQSFGWIAAVMISEPSLSLSIFLGLARLQLTSIERGAISLGVAAAVVALASTFQLNRTMGPLRVAWTNPWRGSREFGLFSFAVAASGLDVTFTGQLAGDGAAGEYGAVKRLVAPLLIGATALNTTSQHALSAANSGLASVKALRHLAPLLALTVGSCLAVAAAAPFLTDLVLGVAYAGAAQSLAILAVATAAATGNAISAVVVQSRGHDRHLARIMMASFVVQLILLALLTPRFGATGSAIAFLGLQVCFGLLVGLLFIRIRKAPWTQWLLH